MCSKRSPITLRGFYAAFDKHPRLEAALEVLFNIIIGFAPFVIIAVAKSENKSQISPMFWSLFSAGELIISLFSTCAAILLLTLFRPQKVNANTLTFCLLIIVILGILFSGVVIGENVGFKDEISLFNQNKILIMYIISLLIWFFISMSNTGSVNTEPSDPTKALDEKYFGHGDSRWKK